MNRALIVAVSMMIASTLGFGGSPLEHRVHNEFSPRPILSDEDKIELMLSRLECHVRSGNADAMAQMFVAQESFRAALRALADGSCEDPRDVPVVDVSVRRVVVTGQVAKAWVTVRVAQEVARDRWTLRSNDVVLDLCKDGRVWRIHPSSEVLDVLASRRDLLPARNQR